jgi:hypothetical protein
MFKSSANLAKLIAGQVLEAVGGRARNRDDGLADASGYQLIMVVHPRPAAMGVSFFRSIGRRVMQSR